MNRQTIAGQGFQVNINDGAIPLSPLFHQKSRRAATRFPTVKHFCSWLGLCPSFRITGGKIKSSHTRSVVNRAANALRLAAQSLSRSQSANGAFYRRLRTRSGAAKANTAATHKLARHFYHLWSTKTAYADSGADYYEQKYRQRIVRIQV